MKNVLITGATGTFGKAFIKLYAKSSKIGKITIFSRDEFKQHNLLQELSQQYGIDFVKEKFKFFLGDVRDRERVSFVTKNADVVIHAAALKHITFCESNPNEAILTNIEGTKNVCDAAVNNEAKKLIVLSTDKAAEPINFYGATKLLGEKYAVHNNLFSRDKTKIACVRYGNIFGSRGSIVEVFKNQLKNENYFGITDKDMTRFWMHINTAAELVMWTIENIVGGEVVIPKIKASKLTDIASVIDSNRQQKIIGIRQGEKLHEQLFSRREHLFAYEHVDVPYYVIVPEGQEFSYLKDYYKTHWKKCARTSYSSNDEDLQMSKLDIEAMIKEAF